MKPFALALGIFALAMPLEADVLVLKDGKTLDWKILVDGGDVYEVTTWNGDVVKIAKNQVARIEKADRPLLTGASFTFDRAQAKALLPLLGRSIKEYVISGNWRLDGGGLTGSAPQPDLHVRMEIPYSPPEEYECTFEAARREGDGDLLVGLVHSDRRLMVVFDHRRGSETGLALDGQGPQASGQAVAGKLFQDTKTHRLRIAVLREAVLVEFDQKPVGQWKVEPGRLFVPAAWEVRNAKYVSFGLSNATWRISNVVITPKK